MPEVELLEVFVSSPYDVENYRKAVRASGRSLRKMRPSFAFELYDSSDLVPGLGGYPQAVVNEQVRDAKMYIGIMGNRMGTPTPDHKSGTEEEFYDALKRFRVEPHSVYLMFYFVKLEFDPHHGDIEQLAKVRRFRSELGEAGAYYRDYSPSEGDFSQVVQHDVIGALDRFWDRGSSSWKIPGRLLSRGGDEIEEGQSDDGVGDDEDGGDEDETDDEEALGIWEEVAQAEEVLPALGDALVEFGKLTEKLGAETEEATSKISSATGAKHRVDISNRLAGQMTSFAERVLEISKEHQDAPSSVAVYAKIIRSQTGQALEESEVDELESMKQAMPPEEAMTNARSSIAMWMSVMRGIDAPTRKFRTANKKIQKALTEFDDLIRRTAEALAELHVALDAILQVDTRNEGEPDSRGGDT